MATNKKSGSKAIWILLIVGVVVIIGYLMPNDRNTGSSSERVAESSEQSNNFSSNSRSYTTSKEETSYGERIMPGIESESETSDALIVDTQPEISKAPEKHGITVTSGLTFRRNEYATISINGEPNTVYSISVYYNSGKSKADGLESKTSDSAGNVSWTWKIGGKTAPGTYKVIISGNGEKIEKEFTVIT